ncbi:MAG TPA: PQQ-binding-like beta-propeller repeat protein [Candidatus Tectomicrobia bacterium]|nr:PQQ-binding-like beta-propeller repeat protein [Candidatus Tectomicrobia bacterium]
MLSRLPRRRWLLVGLALALLAALGGAAALYLSLRTPPQGGLVEPTGISVETVDTAPLQPPPKPVRPAHDAPCWTEFGGGPHRALSRPDVDLGVPRRSVWVRGMRDLMEFPPVYCAGRLFVNLERGRTVAVDATTGEVLWSRRSTARMASSPAISGPNVVVTSFDGTVSALRQKDGRLVWRLHTDGPVESSPLAIGKTVFVGATDGRLLALDAATGKARWVYDFRGRINASPSVVGSRVCITTYSGAIGCLHRASGRRAWLRYFKRDPFRYESFYSSPSSDGRRLFAVARTGRLLALDVRDGRTLWTYRTGALTYATIAVSQGRVFTADLGGDVDALRAGDGKLLWRTRVPGRVLAPCLVVGDLVLFSTLEGRTYAARVSDGRIVWRIRAGKYAPGIATRDHYFLSLNGLLVSFEGARSRRR